MQSSITILNETDPEWDERSNGDKYRKETMDTGVIYEAMNIHNGKVYTGKAYSYVKNGNQPIRRHGAKGRFKKHWLAAHNNETSDCPVFYEALRNSNIDDWFVFTKKVCSKKHLKESETKMIIRSRSYDQEYGYNYFVGDNKPMDEEYLKMYKTTKAQSNTNRAKGGAMHKVTHNVGLPENITKKFKTINKEKVHVGYRVRITLYNKTYDESFMSTKISIEEKFKMAVDRLKEIKKIAAEENGEGKKEESSSEESSEGEKEESSSEENNDDNSSSD